MLLVGYPKCICSPSLSVPSNQWFCSPLLVSQASTFSALHCRILSMRFFLSLSFSSHARSRSVCGIGCNMSNHHVDLNLRSCCSQLRCDFVHEGQDQHINCFLPLLPGETSKHPNLYRTTLFLSIGSLRYLCENRNISVSELCLQWVWVSPGHPLRSTTQHTVSLFN